MVAYKLSGDGICKISKGDRLLTKVKPPNKAGAKLSACSHLLAKASPFMANCVNSVLLNGLPKSSFIPKTLPTALAALLPIPLPGFMFL